MTTGMHRVSGASFMAAVSQGEVEGRAAVRFGLGPDVSAVPVDDTLYGRQADPGSLELLLGVQSLKHPKELIGVLHVEPDPVIAHEVDRLIASLQTSDLNPGIGLVAGEIERISPYVVHHHLQPGGGGRGGR